jgi:predicted enzyme related to lactoylglutathione lyase
MANSMETHGAFSWNELTTTDAAAARKFYGELLGWQFKDMNMGNGTYTVINAGGQDMGGISSMPQTKGMPPCWGAYITVDNVDALAERVKRLGGKVTVAPTDIPTVGRFAVIQDPQGANISLITHVKK